MHLLQKRLNIRMASSFFFFFFRMTFATYKHLYFMKPLFYIKAWTDRHNLSIIISNLLMEKLRHIDEGNFMMQQR